MPERYSEGRVLESESTLLVFFFSSRRRHTRCSRDWSSDVCSSDLVNLGVALAGVLASLILSINIYLESQAFGVFRLGYSRICPTEARIVLVAANVALALSGPGAGVVPVATGAAAALAVGMFVMVAVRIGRNLSALGRLERSEERRVGKECRSRW